MNKKMNSRDIKKGRIARCVKIALLIAILCFGIGVVTAIPQQPYTLYGAATSNGKILTAQDDDVVSLKVDGIELVSYTMGDISGTDNYVLKVSMDSDLGVTTAAQEGDTAYIYINGIAINEGPQIIGAPGNTIKLDISATSAENPPSVTVRYPNGAESISIGTQVQVSAHATDDAAVTGLTFYYSSDGGSNWILVGEGAKVSGTDKDGIWNRTWNTDGLSAGTNYMIKAIASDGTSTSEDQSDSTFSLLPSKVIRVPDDYPTIQAAIDAASPGNTIMVRDGTYIENVDVNKRLTIKSENSAGNCIVQAANSNDDVFEVTMDYVTISGFTVKQVRSPSGYASGIVLGTVKDCEISGNNINFSSHGIALVDSKNNIIKNNIVRHTGTGISLRDSSNYNIVKNNTLEMNNYGISLYNLQYDIGSDENTITCNKITSNLYGIELRQSNSNFIYLNDLNANHAHSTESTNLWNSPSEITYVYNGNSYTSYLGNYWDDYTRSDADGDGIGDTTYSINTDKDFYPLMMPVENYIKQPTITIDTTPPEVICPADVTVELETLVGNVVTLEATATDNSDPYPTITSNELSIYPPGTTIVTFTATDASGNSASCSTNVAVVDRTPPVITNVMVTPTIVSSGTPINISANVFDISKLSLVRAFISKEGEQVATVFMLDPDGDGFYTGTWRTLSSYTEPGIYSIDISATDTEGNEALVKAPEVEITSEATGSISIHSSPSGANIGLDGVPINALTPYTIINVASGYHTLKLTLSGYEDWSTNVHVIAGTTLSVHATLVPI